MTRTFADRPAVREKTPLLVGLVGPSGTGKTYSGLRLATGIQRVSGGDIYVIDTEARRALHYADRFRFRHLEFAAPFGPLDYLAAVEHCVKKGAGVIVVDSTSHEHEGPGGVLEQHEAELNRLAGNDWQKRNKVTMLAWAKPKQQRRQFINTLLQLNCNFVFCFRAKQKLKMKRGEDPIELGYMPIAGEEFVYEMTLKCLLLPGANGVPSWKSEYPGEQAMMKLPEQFRPIFGDGPQLSEDIGQRLAEWAAGARTPADELLAKYAACRDLGTHQRLEGERQAMWAGLGAADKKRLKAASDEAGKRASEPPADDGEPEGLPPNGDLFGTANPAETLKH